MIKTIALENFSLQQILGELLARHQIASGSELAKKVNLPIPTINRLLAGTVTDPRASTLIPIAEYFGITIDQLLGKAPLQMNESQEDYDFFLKLPILSFSELLDENNREESTTPYFNYPLNKKIGAENKDLLAIDVKNDDFLPAFSSGTILIVNRSLLPPESGDYVLVKFISLGLLTIKRFYIDVPNKYLISVMPHLENTIYDEREHKIIGVISEAHAQLK